MSPADTRKLAQYVLRIVSRSNGGSGFVVAPGWVLTCAHVVGDALAVTVSAKDGSAGDGIVRARSARGTAVGLWPYPDLALVEIDPSGPLAGVPCVLLDARDPAPDDECTAFGYALRDESSDPGGTGARLRFENVDGDGYFKLSNGQVARGLSGSPLVSPAWRAVVGVVAGTRDPEGARGGFAGAVAALRDGGAGVPPELTELGARVLAENRAWNLRNRSWHHVFPVPDAAAALASMAVGFSRSNDAVPTELLLPDSGVVPYMFREHALARIVDWCSTDEPVSVMTISAPGGSGKTRFAIEAGRRVCPPGEGSGWLVGRWQRRDLSIAALPLPRLIVVDYAEEVSPADLEALVERLVITATEFSPARLLLLLRQARAESMARWRDGVSALVRGRLDAGVTYQEAVSELDEDQRKQLYTEALNRFADAWRVPRPAPDPAVTLSMPTYGKPLDVLFEALDRVLSSGDDPVRQPAGGGPPVKRILRHEVRYWLAAPNRPSDDPETLRMCVALATLAGGSSPTQVDELLRCAEPLRENPRLRAKASGWLTNLYQGDQAINPLRPDRLGEELVSTVLAAEPDKGAALLAGVLGLPAHDQVTQALQRLVRIASSGRGHREAIAATLYAQHADLVERADHQARSGQDLATRYDLGNALIHIIVEVIDDVARSAVGVDTDRDLAMSYLLLGELAGRTLQSERARRLYEQCRAILLARAAVDPESRQAQRDLGVAYERLGDLARTTGDTAAAKRLYGDALTIRQRLTEAHPDNTEAQRDLSVSYERLGDLTRATGDTAAAKRLYGDALTIRQRLTEAHPDNTEAQRDLSVSYERLGTLAREAGDTATARRLHSTALAMRRRAAADPGNAQAQRDLSVSYNILGDLERAERNTLGAEQFYRDGLEIRERLATSDPGNARAQRDLGVSYSNLGDLAEAEDPVAADRWHRKAFTIRRRLADADPGNAEAQRDLSISYNNLGDLALAARENDASERHYREALTIRQRLADVDPDNAVAQRDLSVSYGNLGNLARANGHHDAAQQWHLEALTIRQRLADADRSSVRAHEDLRKTCSWLGDVTRELGDTAAADEYYRRAMQIERRIARMSR